MVFTRKDGDFPASYVGLPQCITNGFTKVIKRQEASRRHKEDLDIVFFGLFVSMIHTVDGSEIQLNS